MLGVRCRCLGVRRTRGPGLGQGRARGGARRCCARCGGSRVGSRPSRAAPHVVFCLTCSRILRGPEQRARGCFWSESRAWPVVVDGRYARRAPGDVFPRDEGGQVLERPAGRQLRLSKASTRPSRRHRCLWLSSWYATRSEGFGGAAHREEGTGVAAAARRASHVRWSPPGRVQSNPCAYDRDVAA